MSYYIRKYGLVLAYIYAGFLLFLPFGLFLAPAALALFLSAIYLREIRDTLGYMRRENQVYYTRGAREEAPRTAHASPHEAQEVEG